MKRVWHKNKTEWLKWRDGGIGASDAPAIMETSPWVTRTECWARKLKLMEPQPMSYPMLRGIRMEKDAREKHKEILGGIQIGKASFRSTRLPWALASLDGYNEEHGLVAEYKCPLSKKDHESAIAGEIPKHYLWQLVHILMVTELPEIEYGSFDGSSLEIVTFKRDLELEKILIEEERKFWKFVVNGIEPEPIKKKKKAPQNVIELPRKFEFKTRRSRK